MFSPITAADNIKDEFIGYISTLFHISDKDYAAQFAAALREEGAIAKGPYLDVSDSYKTGKSLAQMIEEGEVSSLFHSLEGDIPDGEKEIQINRGLYLHQERALRKTNKGKNMSENNNQSMGDLFPDLGPEVPIISGVAHDSTESLATVRRVPNEPGMAAKVFTMLAEAGVNVDMIVQASASTGTADISFTVPGTAAAKVQEVLQEKQGELGFQSFDVDPNVGKVAVVGVGMKTHSGLAAKFFNALSDKGVNVLMISTSEIRIAALVPLEQLNDAVKALHTAYGLDADQVEAVVYGGTGR